MLTIRLIRKGKKNQPFFKVIVIDKRKASTGGRAVEDLGYVDPLKKRKSFKKDRILYWISKGAKPSATINNFLISEKIIEGGKKIHVSKLSTKKQAEIVKVKEEAEAAVKAKAEAAEAASAAAKAKADEDKAEAEAKAAAEAKPAEEPAVAETPAQEEPASVETPVEETPAE
jgi:small subunit ribosomal protein S16